MVSVVESRRIVRTESALCAKGDLEKLYREKAMGGFFFALIRTVLNF